MGIPRETQEPRWRRVPPPRLKESQSLPFGQSWLLRTSLVPIFTAPLTSHRYTAGHLSVCKLSACSTQAYKGAQIVQSPSITFSVFTYNLASLEVQSWLGPAAPPGGRGLRSRSPHRRSRPLPPSSATPGSFLPLFNEASLAHTPDQVLGTQRGPHRPSAQPQERGVQGRRTSGTRCLHTGIKLGRTGPQGAWIARMRPPRRRSLRKPEGRRGIRRASVSLPAKAA